MLAWYDAGGRDLPWRRTRDPYAILVSEVMAQQTQVARVLERYERWLERWPTAAALAAASPAEVLTEWVGLGYNQRALRLRAACAIVARDGWPRDSAGLRALPGVGPYTAAAVASFAFGERVAAVDTNVRRVARAARREPAALLPGERAPRLEPGGDGARRARLHGPRAALRALPGRAVVPLARPRPPAARRARAAPRAALRGHRPLGARPGRRGARRGRAGCPPRSPPSGSARAGGAGTRRARRARRYGVGLPRAPR